MALPRKAHERRPVFDRTGRAGVVVQYPAAESRLRDEARLEGVHLAAREIAHLVNNDLAVAVGLVDLLQAQAALPAELRAVLQSASNSLDAAARHIEQLQSVVRVVVKETPAGQSLDLERSQRRSQ